MTLKDIIQELKLEIICGTENLDVEVTGGYCSDLLSDVMGHATEGQIWITVQVHQNIVAVAALKELPAILIVKGLNPTKEAIESAKQQGVPVLCTKEPAFEIAGKLYNLTL